jgi:hypothetical protein
MGGPEGSIAAQPSTGDGGMRVSRFMALVSGIVLFLVDYAVFEFPRESFAESMPQTATVDS